MMVDHGSEKMDNNINQIQHVHHSPGVKPVLNNNEIGTMIVEQSN